VGRGLAGHLGAIIFAAAISLDVRALVLLQAGSVPAVGNDGIYAANLIAFAAMHGSPAILTTDFGPSGKPMRRREFITWLGGALTSWPIPANAQPATRVRTVGVLMGLADDEEARGRSMAFEQGLERGRWSLGQNLRIEYRYAEGDSMRSRPLRRSWSN
jgi:hypothetical protein